MAATLAPGKCITYRDSKTNYAVVIAVGEHVLLVARGTKDPQWSDDANLIAPPVEPRSAAARRWTDPPITQTTYFYDFYIKPISSNNKVEVKVHGPCERALWNAIRDAAQPKILEFLARADSKPEIDES